MPLRARCVGECVIECVACIGAQVQGRSVLAACAPRPANTHVGPMVCAWAAPPTCIYRGLRAYQGVDAHIQLFACELHARPGTVVPNMQNALAATARCRHFHRGGLRSERLTTLNRDLTATQRGDLRHPRPRHADDTPPEGFAWRKTPAITPGVMLPHWSRAAWRDADIRR